jgi:hypothetical protein
MTAEQKEKVLNVHTRLTDTMHVLNLASRDLLLFRTMDGLSEEQGSLLEHASILIAQTSYALGAVTALEAKK